MWSLQDDFNEAVDLCCLCSVRTSGSECWAFETCVVDENVYVNLSLSRLGIQRPGGIGFRLRKRDGRAETLVTSIQLSGTADLGLPECRQGGGVDILRTTKRLLDDH